MIKLAICDDEKFCREQITDYINRYKAERNLEIDIIEYASGEAMLADYVETDILLLDVEMNEIDGLYIKDLLGRQRRDTKIIFITSHDEAMSEAFGRQVYGFLKKPVDYELFCRKMDLAAEDLSEDSRYIVYETDDNIQKIFLKDIEYIQSDGRYSMIHISGVANYILVDKSISTYKAEFGEDFGLSHRSYLVNFKYIKSIDKDIVLVSGVHIPMSRRAEKEFKAAHKSYIWRNTT